MRRQAAAGQSGDRSPHSKINQNWTFTIHFAILASRLTIGRMNYRLLGRTGLKVSELCLGTMTFGQNFYAIAVVDQASANAMVAKAFEAGINFFDTADVYSYGESETTLGQALKESGVPRDRFIVATKVRSAMSEAARRPALAT